MSWIILGVTLWIVVHLVPTLAQPMRERLITSWGNGGYRAVFAVTVLLALVLIIVGWRMTPQVTLYQLPAWSAPIGFVLMIVAFILFGSAHHDTIIKRVIRHPQLMSLVVWSISHLITNGSTRALVLFGGLGLWAIIEMPLINAREGKYTKPEPPGIKTELKGLAISAVIFAVALFLHPYFAGVAPIPR